MTYLNSIFLLLFYFCIFSINAQQVDDKIHRLNSLNSSSRDAIESFNLGEVKSFNQYFLNDNWSIAQILGNDKVESKLFLVKYDVLNQQLLVEINNTPMIVSNNKLSGFLISRTEQRFIYARPTDWNTGGSFFEELAVKDSLSLLARHFAIKTKPNYNQALDFGDRNEKVILKEDYYFKSGDVVLEIPNKKKEAIVFFSQFAGTKDYIAKNKINFKKKEDLILLFQNLY